MRNYKLGCRHLDKTKPVKLVNGKDTAHVRTENGLGQNGNGFQKYSLCFFRLKRKWYPHLLLHKKGGCLLLHKKEWWSYVRRSAMSWDVLKASGNDSHLHTRPSFFSFLFSPQGPCLRLVMTTFLAVTTTTANSSFCFRITAPERAASVLRHSGVECCSSGLCFCLSKDLLPGKDAVLGKVHLPCLRFIAVKNMPGCCFLASTRAFYRGLHVVLPNVRWHNGLRIPQAMCLCLRKLRRSALFFFVCSCLPTRWSSRCFPSSWPDIASFRSCLLLAPGLFDTLEAGICVGSRMRRFMSSHVFFWATILSCDSWQEISVQEMWTYKVLFSSWSCCSHIVLPICCLSHSVRSCNRVTPGSAERWLPLGAQVVTLVFWRCCTVFHSSNFPHELVENNSHVRPEKRDVVWWHVVHTRVALKSILLLALSHFCDGVSLCRFGLPMETILDSSWRCFSQSLPWKRDVWVMILQVTSGSSAWLLFPRWNRVLNINIVLPNMNDLKKHLRHRDRRGKQVENMIRLFKNHLEPRVPYPFWERTEGSLFHSKTWVQFY